MKSDSIPGSDNTPKLIFLHGPLPFAFGLAAIVGAFAGLGLDDPFDLVGEPGAGGGAWRLGLRDALGGVDGFSAAAGQELVSQRNLAAHSGRHATLYLIDHGPRRICGEGFSPPHRSDK